MDEDPKSYTTTTEITSRDRPRIEEELLSAPNTHSHYTHAGQSHLATQERQTSSTTSPSGEFGEQGAVDAEASCLSRAAAQRSAVTASTTFVALEPLPHGSRTDQTVEQEDACKDAAASTREEVRELESTQGAGMAEEGTLNRASVAASAPPTDPRSAEDQWNSRPGTSSRSSLEASYDLPKGRDNLELQTPSRRESNTSYIARAAAAARARSSQNAPRKRQRAQLTLAQVAEMDDVLSEYAPHGALNREGAIVLAETAAALGQKVEEPMHMLMRFVTQHPTIPHVTAMATRASHGALNRVGAGNVQGNELQYCWMLESEAALKHGTGARGAAPPPQPVPRQPPAPKAGAWAQTEVIPVGGPTATSSNPSAPIVPAETAQQLQEAREQLRLREEALRSAESALQFERRENQQLAYSLGVERTNLVSTREDVIRLTAQLNEFEDGLPQTSEDFEAEQLESLAGRFITPSSSGGKQPARPQSKAAKPEGGGLSSDAIASLRQVITDEIGKVRESLSQPDISADRLLTIEQQMVELSKSVSSRLGPKPAECAGAATLLQFASATSSLPAVITPCRSMPTSGSVAGSLASASPPTHASFATAATARPSTTTGAAPIVWTPAVEHNPKLKGGRDELERIRMPSFLVEPPHNAENFSGAKANNSSTWSDTLRMLSSTVTPVTHEEMRQSIARAIPRTTGERDWPQKHMDYQQALAAAFAQRVLTGDSIEAAILAVYDALVSAVERHGAFTGNSSKAKVSLALITSTARSELRTYDAVVDAIVKISGRVQKYIKPTGQPSQSTAWRDMTLEVGSESLADFFERLVNLGPHAIKEEYQSRAASSIGAVTLTEAIVEESIRLRFVETVDQVRRDPRITIGVRTGIDAVWDIVQGFKANTTGLSSISEYLAEKVATTTVVTLTVGQGTEAPYPERRRHITRTLLGEPVNEGTEPLLGPTETQAQQIEILTLQTRKLELEAAAAARGSSGGAARTKVRFNEAQQQSAPPPGPVPAASGKQTAALLAMQRTGLDTSALQKGIADGTVTEAVCDAVVTAATMFAAGPPNVRPLTGKIKGDLDIERMVREGVLPEGVDASAIGPYHAMKGLQCPFCKVLMRKPFTREYRNVKEYEEAHGSPPFDIKGKRSTRKLTADEVMVHRESSCHRLKVWAMDAASKDDGLAWLCQPVDPTVHQERLKASIEASAC